MKIKFFQPYLVTILLYTIACAQEYTWGTVTMGGGGFVSAIITSKTEENLIYARTDVGGAYRWDESGRSWIPITDWIGPNDMGLFGIDALALDPSNAQRVYMLAGTDYWNEGKTMILRSDDYGNSFDTINVTSLFKTHGNGYGRQNGERLAVDPNNPDILFCGTRDDGLWKSTDRGDTWTSVGGLTAPANGLGVCFVLFDKNRVASGVTQRIYAGMSTTDGNLYVSDDAGESWSLIAMPELSKQVMPQRAVLTPGGRYLYTTVANGAGPGFGNGVTISRGAVLRYDTREESWEDISPENWIDDPPHPEYPGQTQWDAHFGGFGGISMDPTDSNHVVVSSINAWRPQRWDNSARAGWGDKIFATTDGGASWVSVFGDIGDDEISGVPEDAPIAVLHKNGYKWVEGESVHWAGSIEFDPFDSKRVFVTSGNGIYMADNFSPGERFRWNFTVGGLEETVPIDLVSIPGGPLITVILDYDGFVHDDITKPVSGSRHAPQIGSTTGIDYAKRNPAIVVRVGGNDKDAGHDEYVFPLYYSTDTAKTWMKFATHPEPGTNYKGKIAVSSDGEVALWAPEGQNVMYRTDDWGESWAECGGISNQKPFPTADPVNPDVFYAFGGNIFKSTDKGQTFTQVSERNFSWTNDMQLTPGREGHLWVVGHAWDGVNGGFLARSTDGGATFVDIDPQIDPTYTRKIQHAEAVGFGKAAPGADYPAIYMYGTIDGLKGIYQSIDEAKTWERIDDEQHLYGALANGNFVRGDANTFGVVYRSTAGRGIAARMPKSWKESSTGRLISSYTKIARPLVKLTGNSLEIDGTAAPLTVRMYDLKGRVVNSKTIRRSTVLQLSRLIGANGMYIVSVHDSRNKLRLVRRIGVMKR